MITWILRLVYFYFNFLKGIFLHKHVEIEKTFLGGGRLSLKIWTSFIAMILAVRFDIIVQHILLLHIPKCKFIFCQFL